MAEKLEEGGFACRECGKGGMLFQPCYCHGYVHHACLNQVRTKSLNPRALTQCLECGFTYHLKRTHDDTAPVRRKVSQRMAAEGILSILGVQAFIGLAGYIAAYWDLGRYIILRNVPLDGPLEEDPVFRPLDVYYPAFCLLRDHPVVYYIAGCLILLVTFGFLTILSYIGHLCCADVDCSSNRLGDCCFYCSDPYGQPVMWDPWVQLQCAECCDACCAACGDTKGECCHSIGNCECPDLQSGDVCGDDESCQAVWCALILICVLVVIVFSLVVAIVLLVIVIQKWFHKWVRVKEFHLLAIEYEVLVRDKVVDPAQQAQLQKRIMDGISATTAISHKPSCKNLARKTNTEAKNTWGRGGRSEPIPLAQPLVTPPEQVSTNCFACGHVLAPGAIFCSKCGTQVAQGESFDKLKVMMST